MIDTSPLSGLRLRLRPEEPLAPRTTWRIGGPARFFAEADPEVGRWDEPYAVALGGRAWLNFSLFHRMMDRWGTDTLPLAGEYFRTITKDLMWDNKLFNDTMSVGGRKADISKITVPILHAVAEHDHIVPYEAAKHLIAKVGSTDKEEVILKGGHVSVVAGANAVKRLWPKLDSWLCERSI